MTRQSFEPIPTDSASPRALSSNKALYAPRISAFAFFASFAARYSSGSWTLTKSIGNPPSNSFASAWQRIIPSYEISCTASYSSPAHAPGSNVGSSPGLSRLDLRQPSLTEIVRSPFFFPSVLSALPMHSSDSPAPYFPAESMTGRSNALNHSAAMATFVSIGMDL